jgi:tRNA(adenine34) deaminase
LVPGPDSLAADDERWMRLALDQARAAAAAGEVPIGAAVVRAGQLLAAAHNRVERDQDPSAHAELLALRAATRVTGYGRLVDCVVYSTVEPCFMCASALVQHRVARVVFAARDPKFGGCVSLGHVLDHPGANHRVVFGDGLLADEARGLMVDFFRARRDEARGR